ncbi:beta-parvin isoform x1 [Limosa lapponica baueri]|uniref:Beta-parvin isoform x1 n=1 Tax=Limosa lapponica baueri TaxID=1758121 RepID=A0A2I0U0R1_LIMLA|nr:beta-parvin isoform x1 [Limosa lapponica baueri]
MSAAPVRSPTLRPHRMKKDESFLGKLGGTLARKKKAKEGGFDSTSFFQVEAILVHMQYAQENVILHIALWEEMTFCLL